VPQTAELDDAALRDHANTFLAAIGQGLVTLEVEGAEPLALFRDGSEIQRVISDLHGAQRARLGWTERALRAEYAILREEVTSAVRGATDGQRDVDIEAALDVLDTVLEQAERVSIAGFRRAIARMT
jgi:hypothetical protein